MNGCGGGSGSVLAKAQPALAAFYERLERLIERTHDNADNTGSVVSRALGPEAPQGTSSSNPAQPMPEDVATRLSLLLDRLERATDRQSYQNRRLAEFV